jgi:hypothetical protein
MDPASTKIIACATVIEKVLPLPSPQVQTQTLGFGLHSRSDEPCSFFRHAVDALSGTVYLGKGRIEAGDGLFVEYAKITLVKAREPKVRLATEGRTLSQGCRAATANERRL